MKISEITLINIRGYRKAELKLSPTVNLIVGENNSGKTTILKSILLLHQTSAINKSDIRVGEEKGSIQLDFDGEISKYLDPQNVTKMGVTIHTPLKIEYKRSGELTINGTSGGSISSITSFLFDQEPNNFIYPFLSKRKVDSYSQSIRSDLAFAISGRLTNLTNKLDHRTTDDLPAKQEYIKACKEILGFKVVTYTSNEGKSPVYIVDNFQNIPLESMGEGVSNILGLILDLCIAKNKLFLIEEPENDIHPKALKKLLNLIIEKSKTNQFIITTHSNIVLRHLGAAADSKIFKVNMRFSNERVPDASITEVENSFETRKEILEELGYELLDFDIWDTWLILEESSAETVIREFLIPNFAKKLKGALKTCSSKGIDNVDSTFQGLYNVCLFLHLQESFKNKIWVLVDGGQHEKTVVDKLKSKYKTWNENQIYQLGHHDFERYYPEIFQSRVNEVLVITNKTEKKKAKDLLLKEVQKWWQENPDLAKGAFRNSAKEVIQFLKNIEKSRFS